MCMIFLLNTVNLGNFGYHSNFGPIQNRIYLSYVLDLRICSMLSLVYIVYCLGYLEDILVACGRELLFSASSRQLRYTLYFVTEKV